NIGFQLTCLPNLAHIEQVRPIDIQLSVICARVPQTIDSLISAFDRNKPDVLRFVALSLQPDLRGPGRPAGRKRSMALRHRKRARPRAATSTAFSDRYWTNFSTDKTLPWPISTKSCSPARSAPARPPPSSRFQTSALSTPKPPHPTM